MNCNQQLFFYFYNISFYHFVYNLNVMKIIQKRQDSILSNKKRKMRLQVKSNFFWHLRPECSNEFESKCSFITCRHGIILEGTEINCIREFYYVLCKEKENKKVFLQDESKCADKEIFYIFTFLTSETTRWDDQTNIMAYLNDRIYTCFWNEMGDFIMIFFCR